ncbi:hypothetical protein LOTGIDRAFT_155128 [Lottia gigantea]|uniref:NHR domain-containing protein n=1 Tax=Lottia gigantea TaxID=225164 RepID=V3ZMU4_LOTGI|nr:hypothetical protein LOTGIDRAFT_155128 [Lottia gigantea]ESO85637.1 hypothetical protein LOTGIDRAFT_155128 [Lottia gigantea]
MQRNLDELSPQHAALKDLSVEDLRQLPDELYEKYGGYRIKDKCKLKQKCYQGIGISKPDINDKRTYRDIKRIFGELDTVKLTDELTAEGLGFEDVIYLSDNDLKTIGIESASERCRIIIECKRLMRKMQYEYDLIDHEGIFDRMKNGNTRVLKENDQFVEHERDSDRMSQENGEASKFKKIFGDLYTEEVADNFRAEGIGFEDVIYLSDNDLKTLGVKSASGRSRIIRECKRLLKENDQFVEHERDSDRMSQENGEASIVDQGLQMNVDLSAYAKFEKGDRGNVIKCSEKISVKMKENATYKQVRENNRIERNQNYEADHIGNTRGYEASSEDNVKVEIGANSQFEMSDSNNIFKSSHKRNIDIKVGDNVVLNGDLGKVDHITNRAPPPLKFHSNHGRNINLSPDQMTATRNGHKDESIDVFSSRPLSCEEAIEVVVQIESRMSDSLSFGLTTCNPANLIINELPDDSRFLTEREEYWVIKENFCKKLTKGDILRLYLRNEGDVFYSINNETEIFLMAVDVSCPVWAHFRLNGSVQEIKVLGNTTFHNKETECQPSAVNSTPSASRPISTPRPDQLELKPIKFHKKCGGNISLNHLWTSAERCRSNPQDTYVFTSRNIYPGEQIDLQINTGRECDGLKLGLTVCNPEDLNIKELPNDSRFLTDREEYWLIDKLLYKTSQTHLKARVRYTNEGYVLYSINNQEEKLLFCVDTSVDLWAYFILRHNQSIEIISKDSPSNKENRLRETRPSRSSTDNNSSNIVKNIFKSAISTAAGIGATVVAIPFAGAGAPLVGIAAGVAVNSTLK